ncbi:MAG: hypothetical protein J6U54_07845, partial [Clostridiales bacterium]|nr:hypothetical protein [Clostridiales bacterium]
SINSDIQNTANSTRVNTLSAIDIVNHANGLKNSLTSVYELLDQIQPLIPLQSLKNSGKSLREFFEFDIFTFVTYLVSSDGKITTKERDFMNIAFNHNWSIQEYVKLINDFHLYSNDFAQNIPVTIMIVSAFDKDTQLKTNKVPRIAPILMQLYQTTGKVVINLDGETNDRETCNFNAYTNRLNSYIISITGVSGINQVDDPNEVGYIDNAQSTNAPSSTSPTVSNTNVYPASIYKVGSDIPAGKYKLFSDTSGTAYYSLCNDPNGDDIIANDNYYNQAYVDIHNGQYLELSDCHAIPLKDAKMFQGTLYEDGEYLVGQEIAPGEYKVQSNPGDDGYYSLETFGLNGSRDIDSNRTFTNSSYVAIKQGQILILKDCTLSM